ncbi:ATP-binding cassette domain-containing protein [Paraburkholderia kururiensis]|uniref:ATP-binding cassette domain-containing protein n=1 Tax=Paraburkholderia kururiensis TaxID=984307 RepID=UPI0009DADDF6|nr:ATP-binding cassette domain-containing protein [Paraburkholderia kururiensis]
MASDSTRTPPQPGPTPGLAAAAQRTPSQERDLRRRIFVDLGRAIWQYRNVTLVSVALMVAAKLAAVGVPLVLKRIVDEVSHPSPLALFPVFLVLAYAILRFVSGALNEVRDVVFSVVTQRTVASFTERTFAHLHRLGARFHATRETGAVVRDVQKGTDGIGYLLGIAIFTIVPTLIEIGSVIAIMMASYAATFTAIIGMTFVVYAIYTVIFTRRRLVHQRAVNRLEAQTDSRFVDSMLNYDTVKYFATEALETRRLSGILGHWITARMANQRALSTLHIGQSAVIAFGVASVMLLAVQYVMVGRMSVGDLVLVNAYIIQVCLPLNSLGFVFRETNDAMVNVERMFGILAAQGRVGEDLDEPGAQPLAIHAGEIAYDHVDFGYDPQRQVLHGIDLRVRAGTSMAVVGGSGSGKSTLVKLLFRLYQPTSGTVRIDGQDLRYVTQTSLREAIGIVPQDTVLFNDTIAYNIAYGRPGATRADVVRAARAAQLDGFIERLPDHYDTQVGERGVRLSGGERQRIAIARAILKDPRIIVFDEATSALDTRSERAIQLELQRLAQGRTSITIAHRLSTVVDADTILVMEHGHIVEQGTHEALLAREGVYMKMWSLQQQQGELERAQRRLVAQPVELDELVAHVAAMVRTDAARQRADFTTLVAEPGLFITGERDKLVGVVAELCRNELTHAPRGGRVQLRTDHFGNEAWLTVVGAGDRPADLSQERARKLEATIVSAGGGFTVMPVQTRLAYVVTLPLRPVVDVPVASSASATSVASAASVASVVQGGVPASSASSASSVSTAVPGVPGTAAPPSAPSGSARHFEAQPLEGIAVLAIDDQEETRDALEAMLSSMGARVQTAQGGDDTLAMLEDEDMDAWPDVLVCDIVLEREDGFDVLRRVRELEARRGLRPGARLPAIALTGYTLTEDGAVQAPVPLPGAGMAARTQGTAGHGAASNGMASNGMVSSGMVSNGMGSNGTRNGASDGTQNGSPNGSQNAPPNGTPNDNAVAAGFAAHLTKPVPADQLIDAIRRVAHTARSVSHPA